VDDLYEFGSRRRVVRLARSLKRSFSTSLSKSVRMKSFTRYSFYMSYYNHALVLTSSEGYFLLYFCSVIKLRNNLAISESLSLPPVTPWTFFQTIYCLLSCLFTYQEGRLAHLLAFLALCSPLEESVSNVSDLLFFGLEHSPLYHIFNTNNFITI
jgi:hypothetical protein